MTAKTTRPRRKPSLCLPVLLSLGMLALAPATTWARGKGAGAGPVALTATALPGKKGTPAFLRALKKEARGRAVFHEDRASRSWKVHYAARVSRPVRDVTIRIFDISRGRTLVGSRDKMLFAESNIVSGSLSLSRDEVFHPNSRLLLVIESPGGTVLATRTFFIQGKAGPQPARRRVVQMDFTADDDAGGKVLPSIEEIRPRHRRRR
jgi:hypothetical protein